MAYYGKKEPILIPQKSEAGRPLVAGNYVYWVSQSYRDSEGKVGDDRKTIGRIVDNDRTKMWPNNTNYTLIFGTDDDSGDERTHASQMSGGQYIAITKAADQMGVIEALTTAFPKEWPKILALQRRMIMELPMTISTMTSKNLRQLGKVQNKYLSIFGD